MEPEHWQRVEELYHAARTHRPSSRGTFLAAACAGDDQLRHQVELLLEQDSGREGILDRGADDLLTYLADTVLLPGARLGPYRLEAPLGRGGMGEVFRAVDTRLNRPVAVKVCSGSFGGRFAREARAIAALNHPHVCTLYDVGHNYLVMELVEGGTLSDRLARGALPLDSVLRYAIEIADAVAAAHAHGIVHRDLKPGNIMITESGVKVLDFGLAKLREPASGAAPETESGAVLGTAGYMSPEQAEGRKADERSDIFSFGAVLYEMATGRQPFAADSRVSVLTKVVHEEPVPPIQICPSIPPELDRIVLRCLRKDPARRYQMMADVKLAIEEVKTESPRLVHVRNIRRRWIWAAGCAAACVLVYFGWREWFGAAEPLQAVPLTTYPGAELFPSWSPDGNQVTFSWNGPNQDNPDIYVQMIGGAGAPHRLTTNPANDYDPVWSPDGRWIAFLRTKSQSLMWDPIGRNELRLIPPLGGPDHLLTEVLVREESIVAPRLAWCPDSKCLIVTDSPGEGQPDALFRVSLETGEKRQLTTPQRPAIGDSNPAVAPDGRSMVFRRNIGHLMGEINWTALGDGYVPKDQPKRLTRYTDNAWYPAWTPDGKDILFASEDSLWRMPAQGGHPAAKLPFVGQDGVMPSISHPASGGKPRLVYARSLRDFNIWRIERSPAGAWEKQLAGTLSSSKLEQGPRFSPDGRKVAFASGRSGRSEIWVTPADGSNLYQLTSMGATDTGTPEWSSDGQRIAFDSNLEGHYDVYVVPAAGGKIRRLTFGSSHSQLPCFSADGSTIYFSSNRGDVSRSGRCHRRAAKPFSLRTTEASAPGDRQTALMCTTTVT
jgi:serine/threonine protein kinase